MAKAAGGISGELDGCALRSRFLLLSGLRWFPGGLILPVLVILMSARGLDLLTIGSLFAVFSALVALLELPTGGLADVIGRRPVFIASSLLSATAFALLAMARDTWQFVVALVVYGTGRALSSGPLHAWYVDSAQGIDPTADLQPALAREGLVTSFAIGSGVFLGGFIPGAASKLLPGLPTSGHDLIITLSIPFWLASLSLILVSVALSRLMTESSRGTPGSPKTAGLYQVLTDVPRTIKRSALFAISNRAVVTLLAAVLLTGAAISATEVLAPVYFAQLAGSESASTAIYGILLTAVFFAAGSGSAVGPVLSRGTRGLMRAATVAAALGSVAYLVMGATAGLFVGAVAYLAVYVCLGIVDPLRQEQLHYHTQATERSSMLSVESMAQMIGGVLGALLIPRLADQDGVGVGWWACAGILFFAGVLTLFVRDKQAGAISG